MVKLEIKEGNCKFCCKLEAAIDQKREEMKGSGRRDVHPYFSPLLKALDKTRIFNVMMQSVFSSSRFVHCSNKQLRNTVQK